MPKVIGHNGVRFMVVDDSDTIKKTIERLREQKKLRKREKKKRKK